MVADDNLDDVSSIDSETYAEEDKAWEWEEAKLEPVLEHVLALTTVS